MIARTFALALLAAALVVGCNDEEEERPEPERPVTPIERPSVVGPRPLASRVAYDLVLAGEGAVLIWGPPSDQGGGLRAARLDAMGTRQGYEVRVYEPARRTADEPLAPSALEVSAAVAGGKLAILWVERDGVAIPVRAEIGDAATLSFGAAHEIAEGVVLGMNYRGHVAVSGAPDGSFVGIYRGVDRACEEGGTATCAGFEVRPIRADRVGETRVPLAVPAPCRRAIVGIASDGERTRYGVCSEPGGRAATTVYTTQRDPEYARSDQVLEDCAPIGATRIDGTTWVLGRCGGEARQAARFESPTEAPVTVIGADAPIRCEDGRPVVSVAEGASIELTAPMDRLDPLLPATLTDLGARAVWTGRAMLVAVALGREVAIHRYECEQGEFLRTDVL